MLTRLSVPTRRNCRRLAVVVDGAVIILPRNYRAGTVDPTIGQGKRMRGGRIALSPPRRLLTDLSHLSRGFPRATLLTRINVAALAGSRDQARIPWPVVFAKAYALVAAGSPPLRRVYVKLPWPHLYELPQSVASIIVERDWPHDGDRDEKALFLGRLKAPDTATLPNLATRMLALKSAPIAHSRSPGCHCRCACCWSGSASTSVGRCRTSWAASRSPRCVRTGQRSSRPSRSGRAS